MNIDHWWNDKGKKTRSNLRLLDGRPPNNRLNHGFASEFDLKTAIMLLNWNVHLLGRHSGYEILHLKCVRCIVLVHCTSFYVFLIFMVPCIVMIF